MIIRSFGRKGSAMGHHLQNLDAMAHSNSQEEAKHRREEKKKKTKKKKKDPSKGKLFVKFWFFCVANKKAKSKIRHYNLQIWNDKKST